MTILRTLFLLLAILSLFPETATAQGFRPPAFVGGIPGQMQSQAVFTQRHQARTLLYREALEELRQNPQAADLPECGPQVPSGKLCLKTVTPAIQSDKQPTPITASSSVAAEIKSPPSGKRIAYLFGNNAYKKPIPELETPIADVSKTAEILRSRFGYDAKVIANANKETIITLFNDLARQAQPEDSILLFYAGHGYLMEDTKMGFWIPVDASVKTAANWISNTDISKLLSAIQARQLILISDSCFSGSLTREQKMDDSKKDLATISRLRSVLVFSSGGEEPVSDEGKDGHSIFAWNLIRTLDAITQTTPGREIWQTVHQQVSKEYPQEPQYGAVPSAGHHSGGEYFFQPR